MSSKNSEAEWTFTASWPHNFTGIPWTNLSQVKEELESSLNLAVAMEREVLPLSEPREQERTVRLYISRTSKGYKRVISIEEHTPSSLPSGSELDKSSGLSMPGTEWNGDHQDKPNHV